MNKIIKLKTEEEREDIFATWGRIRAMAGNSPYGKAEYNEERLKLLIEKFNKDLGKAKIEPNFFK